VTLTNEQARRVHAINDTLVLNSVALADTGNYTCHVTNMAATRARTVYIVVSGKSSRSWCTEWPNKNWAPTELWI